MIFLRIRISTCIILVAVALVVAAALSAAALEAQFVSPTLPGGFSLSRPVAFYDSGDLYEYIDGQAIFYLSYKFKRLEHGVYTKGDAEYYVDVYELGGPLSAFGSYSQQRETDAAELNAGLGGAITDYLSVFHKGPYYIEIIPMSSGTDDIDNMKQLAAAIDTRIPGSPTLPAELGYLPTEGQTPGSLRYMDENLLSYSFMGRGIYATYPIEGQDKELRIFISFLDDLSKTKPMFDEYLTKLQNSSTVRLGDLEGHKGTEPYRGTTLLFTSGKFVFGCLGAENEGAALKLLAATLENLKSAK